MKRNRLYTGLLLAAGLYLAACNKADEDYKDFVPDGEKVYPGKVEELEASPGKNRIMLAWLLKTDPRIVKCRIYWNRKKDSADVTVKRTNGVDTISAVLNNMTEGPYLFEVYTYNAQGNQSIKTEVNGDVYGDFYESNLQNRGLKKAAIVNGTTKLEWDEPDPRSPGVRLTFLDEGGETHSITVLPDENMTVLNIIPKTGTMEFKTLYLPVANAIDTFAAPVVKVNL
ncbi:DUF4998 domain-containing protein [Chitinophaga sp. YIM B06452]|uniref:DUF4998 domain-containing protein n=1 Tax=Chitinophaga sp. YIM B06452 TaxID=3082158 RepID=UPI0031FF0138